MSDESCMSLQRETHESWLEAPAVQSIVSAVWAGAKTLAYAKRAQHQEESLGPRRSCQQQHLWIVWVNSGYFIIQTSHFSVLLGWIQPASNSLSFVFLQKRNFYNTGIGLKCLLPTYHPEHFQTLMTKFKSKLDSAPLWNPIMSRQKAATTTLRRNFDNK